MNQNAVKFNRKNGEIKVIISFHEIQRKKNDDKRYGYLVTQVVDTGYGIDRDKFRSLFETFNSKKGIKDLKSGVGIGLSTAKKLTKTMCGAIQL